MTAGYRFRTRADQNIVYKPTYGKLISRRLYQNKPPNPHIPPEMQWDAVNI
jgi:hypothetical protein